MRVGKKLSAFLLGILLLFDALIAYRIFDHGWPKYLKAGPSETLQVVRVPFTWQDGLILLGIAAPPRAGHFMHSGNRSCRFRANKPGSTSTMLSFMTTSS